MKKFTLILSAVFVFQLAIAQTITAPFNSPAFYVQNVLLGNYVGVLNVTSTAVFDSSGYSSIGMFNNFGAINFPVNDGLIMSTGAVQTALGQNNSGSTTYNWGLPGDSTLALYTTGIGYDASVIEFDYIPYTNVLNFTYLFGSEEYAEFVGSSFNDVFGFFVTGLSPYGGFYQDSNIAIIPGTNLPVAINNLNNGASNTGPCMNCQYYIHNSSTYGFTFDGYTTPLNAIVDVIPFTLYHIKLAVMDVADGVYDSGVLLQENSFACQPLVYNVVNPNSTQKSAENVIEDSTSVNIEINLPKPALTEIVYHYQILGSATNGVDYQAISDSIVFPVGSSTQTISIIPITDTINEPTEDIVLVMNTLNDTIAVDLVNAHYSGVGMDKPSAKPVFNIFPNPANDVLNIVGNQDFEQISILDISGKTVLKLGKTRIIDVSTLMQGVYFLKISGENEIIKRFVKL